MFISAVLCTGADSKNESQPIKLTAMVEVSPRPPMPDDDINDLPDEALLLEYMAQIFVSITQTIIGIREPPYA